MAPDEAVEVGVEGFHALDVSPLIPDLYRAPFCAGFKAQRYLLPHECGVDLVDDAIKAHRAVFLDGALGLEEEDLVEVQSGKCLSSARLAQRSRGVCPSRERWGVWWYSPSTQAQRRRLRASRLRVSSGVRRVNSWARKVRNQCSTFPLPWACPEVSKGLSWGIGGAGTLGHGSARSRAWRR